MCFKIIVIRFASIPMIAQVFYQVFKIFRDYFLLTAGGLTRRKRIEIRQTLFDEQPVPASADLPPSPELQSDEDSPQKCHHR